MSTIADVTKGGDAELDNYVKFVGYGAAVLAALLAAALLATDGARGLVVPVFAAVVAVTCIGASITMLGIPTSIRGRAIISITIAYAWLVAWITVGPAMHTFLGLDIHLAAMALALAPLVVVAMVLSPWDVAVVGAANAVVLWTMQAQYPGEIHSVVLFLNVAISILLIGASLVVQAQRRQVIENDVALTRSLADLGAILESSPDLIWSTDCEGQLTLANRAGLAWLTQRLDGEPDEGDNILAAINTLEGLHTSAMTGVPGTTTWRDESPRQAVSLGSVPLRAGERVIGVAFYGRDITIEELEHADEREKMESALQVQKLHEVNRFKTQLLNTAGHELSTPLTPMRLQASLLASGKHGDLTAGQRRAAELLERNTRRMESLVRDILDVSRIEARKLPIEKTQVDLAAVVRDETENVRPTAEANDVAFAIDAPNKLIVECDGMRITQVLVNFLNNACKFSSGGSVRVSLRQQGNTARLEVADDGIGMTSDDAAKLFQPFVQIHNDQKQYGGTGLGLSICRGIAQAHGGRVGCYSDGPGKGSTFWLALPIQSLDIEDGMELPGVQPEIASDAPRLRQWWN